jgi:hypothetical protein
VDNIVFEISSSHGGEFEVQICLLGCTAIALMMEAARTSETPVDNYFTQQCIPEDKSEHSIYLWLPVTSRKYCSAIYYDRMKLVHTIAAAAVRVIQDL